MEAVRGIILSVVCAALICGILTDLSAKTGFSKLIRLSCSIFLAFTMIAPILRLRFPKWEAQKNQYLAEAQDAALAGENIRLRSVAGIIRQEAEAYILKEAKSIGANLEVEVELDSGDPPAPAAVTVRGDFDESAETQLSRLLEDELGIPKEHQTWIRQQSHSSSNSSQNTSPFF